MEAPTGLASHRDDLPQSLCPHTPPLLRLSLSALAAEKSTGQLALPGRIATPSTARLKGLRRGGLAVGPGQSLRTELAMDCLQLLQANVTNCHPELRILACKSALLALTRHGSQRAVGRATTALRACLVIPAQRLVVASSRRRPSTMLAPRPLGSRYAHVAMRDELEVATGQLSLPSTFCLLVTTSAHPTCPVPPKSSPTLASPTGIIGRNPIVGVVSVNGQQLDLEPQVASGRAATSCGDGVASPDPLRQYTDAPASLAATAFDFALQSLPSLPDDTDNHHTSPSPRVLISAFRRPTTTTFFPPTVVLKPPDTAPTTGA
uniref:Uncharacterized protein n=1 Tax=Mycena chlorophos TaxID=658473 RepID=A0ABQ0LWK0_MYCCL|nr:predicted protein [Mycena chlorophos]